MQGNNEKDQLNIGVMIQNEMIHFNAIQTDIEQLRDDVTALVEPGQHVLTTGICRINLMGAPNQNLRAPHSSQANNEQMVPIRIDYVPANPATHIQWGEHWTIHFRPIQNIAPKPRRLIVVRGNPTILGTNPNHWHVTKYDGQQLRIALNIDGQPAVIDGEPGGGIWELCVANERQVNQMNHWFHDYIALMNIINARIQAINTAIEGLNDRFDAIPRQPLHPLLEEYDDRIFEANIEFNEIRDQYMEFRRTIDLIREQQHTAVNATITQYRRLY